MPKKLLCGDEPLKCFSILYRNIDCLIGAEVVISVLSILGIKRVIMLSANRLCYQNSGNISDVIWSLINTLHYQK